MEFGALMIPGGESCLGYHHGICFQEFGMDRELYDGDDMEFWRFAWGSLGFQGVSKEASGG